MKRKELGVAVIGAGRIGAMRARLAANHPAVRFLAVSDVDAERARTVAEKAGAQLASGDNDEVISHPAVNAVIVSTGEHEHVEPVLPARERDAQLARSSVDRAPLRARIRKRCAQQPRSHIGDRTSSGDRKIGAPAARRDCALTQMKFWLARVPMMMLAGCLTAGAAAQVTPQSYPSKPVRWIVPFAAGGPSDLLVRLIGQKLTDAWGQPVLADNRGGANGVVGSELAAKSAPDGYTILLGTNGTHGINASLFAKLPYDTISDFAPITRIGQVPFLLVAHPSLPARTVPELIKLARLKPGQISYASGGSASQLAAELFKSMARVDMLHVPYKGASVAITDVIGGQVSITFGGVALALPQVKAGRLRALAVTGSGRSAVVPDVPTVGESGVPGYEVSTWYGVFAPSATPRAIVERINAEIVKSVQTPDVKERLRSQAFEPLADTPEQFAALVRTEIVKWAKVVKESGARVE